MLLYKIMLKKILKWIPALFIMGVSWYLSSKSLIGYMPKFINADKLVHLVCFAGLAFWVSFALNIKTYKSFWIPTIIVSTYGIIDEIHQHFTPGRYVSFFDWTCDTIGAILGSLIFVLVYKIVQKMSVKEK